MNIDGFDLVDCKDGFRRHRSQRDSNGNELVVQVSPPSGDVVRIMIGVYGKDVSVTAHGTGSTYQSALDRAKWALHASVSAEVWNLFCELVDVPAVQVAA
jgi:hypothetical protein